MDVDTYLRRIGFDRPEPPSAAALRRLHRRHLETVPFENLDIPLGRPLTLTPEALYEKIVERRRGGFCYELNGLFCWLLGELGYDVQRLAAAVYGDDGPGQPFAHMLLKVELATPWIADVGFGDSFLVPLPLSEGERGDGRADYRLSADGASWVMAQRPPGADWQAQYRFDATPREMAAFGPMCRYQQTAPHSAFTGRSVCSRATPDGRVTFADGRLIVTRQGRREERAVPDSTACRALLREHFGVELDATDPIERLLDPAGTRASA